MKKKRKEKNVVVLIRSAEVLVMNTQNIHFLWRNKKTNLPNTPSYVALWMFQILFALHYHNHHMCLFVVFCLQQTIKPNTVDIMRFTYSTPMGKFQVPVDDTMTQLTVLLSAKSTAPVCIPSMPLGV